MSRVNLIFRTRTQLIQKKLMSKTFNSIRFDSLWELLNVGYLRYNGIWRHKKDRKQRVIDSFTPLYLAMRSCRVCK